jgi:hypothetical protein
METKTAAELVALVVREIREHPEYDHIAGVSVMPRIPQPSHPANWRVELSVTAGLAHVVSPAANRSPSRKSLRCSGLRQCMALGITTGVTAWSRLIVSLASSSRPMCA